MVLKEAKTHPQNVSNFALFTNKLSFCSYVSCSLYSSFKGIPLFEQ